MKLLYLSIFLALTTAIFAHPGDSYNCNGGHWVVMDEVAGSGTIPGTVPTLPTPAYTAEPLYPSCRPVARQTPTPKKHTVNLPFIANGE